MERNVAARMLRSSIAPHAFVAVMTVAMFGAGSASAASATEGGSALRNRTIGYVLTDRYWAVYETKDGKTECPQGFNDGPREQFKKLFPDDHFENEFMRRYDNDRVLIELTGVDDLTNDDDVTVTTYRGLDALLTDAAGNAFIPGGTQRVDMRWGKEYIQKFKGKIVAGVLTTEPVDTIEIPWGVTFETGGHQVFRGLRFKLKLTPQGAEGLMAGYVDVESFTHHLNTSWSTHHPSYGQLSSPSQYRALRRLADGYPDPKTGANTAISAAVKAKFTQVFIQHPPEQIVSKNLDTAANSISASHRYVGIAVQHANILSQKASRLDVESSYNFPLLRIKSDWNESLTLRAGVRIKM